jgi:hypothetical protein
LPEALPCPGFRGGKELDSAAIIVKGDDMARRGYPPEFRSFHYFSYRRKP